MKYVLARIKDRVKTYAYRYYITDGIKVLTSNTAKFAGGSELVLSYREMIDVNSEKDPDKEKSGEEIIAHMKKKISMLGGG